MNKQIATPFGNLDTLTVKQGDILVFRPKPGVKEDSMLRMFRYIKEWAAGVDVEVLMVRDMDMFVARKTKDV